VVGSIGGVLTVSILLLFPDRSRIVLLPWLISYAVGTLLAAALLLLLPEALDIAAQRGASAATVLWTLLAGILAFFVLETLVLWRHCHADECQVHPSAAALVLLGDTFHNFIDGAIICAAVMTSVPLGVNTAIAVATHEIPQEVGDFAVLLGAGYSRRRAFRLNLLSAAAGVVGATLMYVAANLMPALLPYMIPFSAGGLLYVAMSDLIPSLHRGTRTRTALRQLVLVAAGIATVMMM
jgi:zinc and cadmium transporter